jgi:Fe-S-cluster-containing dehydrogenase component
MKVFVIDIDKCSGCHNCQIACKDEHCGNDWMPYAKPQPNSGQFWMKVNQKDHGQVPKVRVEYTPWMCMHCDNPACKAAAPDAVEKRADGIVLIDPIKSQGRRDLVDACPYGAIYYNEELDIPQKCTGCAHLLDEGEVPHCVDLCATGALRFGDEEEFAEEISNAETFDFGNAAPRVYYLNRPHLFIGGEVWDPIDNEIIEGASIELSMPDGSIKSTHSDDFGDFWFKRIDEGRYSLAIKADGFKDVEVKDIDLCESLNLGDFPLERA